MNIVVGLVVIVAFYLLRTQLAENGLEFLYYLGLAAGIAVLGYGGWRFWKARTESDAEREVRQRKLGWEVLLKSMARVSASDTNIKAIEVSTIQAIYKQVTNDEVSAGEVRLAANADLYEDQPFPKYLSRIEGEITVDDKKLVMRALAAVIRADGRISPLEVGFFNEVGAALKLSPADLADLAAPAD